ncbi:MAG: hypothetical protein JEZ08_24125 [Clostridiales bacterium]|nr:hypothetical protein [Clostridiales bacterium]
MKLVSDYRVRVTKWLYLTLLPLVVYFILFKTYIYDLVAGGIIFVYWTLLLMFISRYIKVWLKNQLEKRMHFEPIAYYKTLKPKSFPSKMVSAIDIQKIEGYPVIVLMAIQIIAIMLSYSALGDVYLTKILVGGFILSFNINYSNFCYIKKTLDYPNAMYEYNKVSIKIYDTPINGEYVS